MTQRHLPIMLIDDVRHQPVLGIMTPAYNANDALDAGMWLNHPCPCMAVGIDLGRHGLLDTAQKNHAYTFINMTETSTLTMSNQLVFRGTPKISDQYAI